MHSFSSSFAGRFLEASWRRCHSSSQVRALCGALAVVRQKIHWIITINGKMNVWKCKLILPTDTLQQKIEINDLNPFFFFFFAGENTSVLIILATTLSVSDNLPRPGLPYNHIEYVNN